MEKIIRRALLVGANLNDQKDFVSSMEELANLAQACELEVVGEITQNLKRIHQATYIGSGKVEEIRLEMEAKEADLIIFNDELSPSQIRNLEMETECSVIDRTILILDIFARRAKTREAMLQVEIAQLRYMMPRIIGLGASLSRQQGGIGPGARGPGEKKLELDRRRIESQISALDKELEHLLSSRQTQRKARQKNALPTVALVGYTNAGKSTTMNAILDWVQADASKLVFEKNMLFATLGTSTRRVKLKDNKEFLLTDTVGFVSKLPHHLVKAFRSTLEEVLEADLLLHIVDLSHPDYESQLKVTHHVLEELGADDIPTICVYNKCDLNKLPPECVDSDHVLISAKKQLHIEGLLEMIKEKLFVDDVEKTFLIPYDRGSLVSFLNENAAIYSTDHLEAGTKIKASLSKKHLSRLQGLEI